MSENKQNEANNLLMTEIKLFDTLGYLTTITNVISCLILFMTVRHAYKLTQKQDTDNINRKLQLNARVTSMHIILIVGATISAFIVDKTPSNKTT